MIQPMPVWLRIAGAALAVPVVLAVSRFGLAWPPSPARAAPPHAFASPTLSPPSASSHRPAPHKTLAIAVVYVAGAVARPGLVSLPAGSRVAAALSRATPRSDADLVAVNLAARVQDGEEIVVPVKGAAAASVSTRGATHGRSPRRAAPTAAPPAPVSLNQADVRQLARVPGIGSRLAERIVAYRETYGPFASTDDLLDVAGITERSLERASPFLRP